jgi:hypothetical protein
MALIGLMVTPARLYPLGHVPEPPSTARTTVVTAAALVGFAANSLLCRAALGAGEIDAWSFTAVRIGSGALALAVLARSTRRAGATSTGSGGSFGSALALWGYAAAFSLAYLRLPAGIGALVLFACVQATMIGWSAFRGARPSCAASSRLSPGWSCSRCRGDSAGAARSFLDGARGASPEVPTRCAGARAARCSPPRAPNFSLGALLLTLVFTAP